MKEATTSRRWAAPVALLVACVGSATASAQTTEPSPIYAGWRLFQQHCARCHGSDAEGTDQAPDLRRRLGGMSRERFVATVLQRYQWVVPAGEAAREGAGREALVQDVLRRQEQPTAMPAWEGQPEVRAHILDLYSYLEGRASGKVPKGVPAR